MQNAAVLRSGPRTACVECPRSAFAVAPLGRESFCSAFVLSRADPACSPAERSSRGLQRGPPR
eukprot:136432-Lingulodinium_polyedra.AAC.1